MKHKSIKTVLMCEPTYFSLLDYKINPWMQPGHISAKKSMSQWEHLVQTYKNLGIHVEVIPQQKGHPDMVFATDQGIVQGKTVLLSRFWRKERRGESDHYEVWFTERGYTVHKLPRGVYFEGNGDTYFWNNMLFVGVGYRADAKTCKAIQKIFDAEVVPLQITDPRFYHLDVGFLPLNHETVFYYPQAFSEKSQKELQKRIPNLLEFTEKEVLGFCANSVVTDHHVVHQVGNPTFKKKLESLGYTSVEVDLREFMKSGGGAHCLTNILG